MHLLVNILKAFAQWFAFSLAAWVIRQFFNATISPWFENALEHMRARSMRMHAAVKGRAKKATGTWQDMGDLETVAA